MKLNDTQRLTTKASTKKLNEQQKCKWRKNDESGVKHGIRSIAYGKYDNAIDDDFVSYVGVEFGIIYRLR